MRYATDTSLDNRIPRYPSILTVSPYREPTTTSRGPRLKHLTVQVSFDGTTWRPALAWSWASADWHALLPTPPAGATTVSLRLTATDTTNATITQEIHNAYGIEY